MSKVGMRVLFVIRSVELFLYYRSIVEALATRGHEALVLFDRQWSRKRLWDDSLLRKRGVSYGWASRDKTAKWRRMIFYALDLLSLRRYFNIPGTSSFYKDRWQRMMPSPLRFIFKIPGVRRFLLSDPVSLILKFAVNHAPLELKVEAEIKKYDPDVVCTAPVDFPSSSCDLEYLRTAKVLGVPTALPIFSWDNLTTKGIIHVKPDLLLVWNKIQAGEAIKYHGIDPATVKICGSFFFDLWFSYNSKPPDKDKFASRLGLLGDEPIILYLGSSVDTAGDETWIVREIRSALDQDKLLSSVQIIVRPHPHNAAIFKDFKMKNVVVAPKNGSYPDTEEARKFYFESLYFSQLAVGVNTSGMIDAIILDKPVVSFLDKTHKGTQTEAEHFKYLVKSEAIELADNMEIFLKLIKTMLAGKDERVRHRLNFVKKYIRPGGLENSAGEVATLAIEDLVKSR